MTTSLLDRRLKGAVDADTRDCSMDCSPILVAVILLKGSQQCRVACILVLLSAVNHSKGYSSSFVSPESQLNGVGFTAARQIYGEST
jgi:hypothetical protein